MVYSTRVLVLVFGMCVFRIACFRSNTLFFGRTRNVVVVNVGTAGITYNHRLRVALIF